MSMKGEPSPAGDAAAAWPPGHPANPGHAARVRFDFERAQESGPGIERWSEEIDLVQALLDALAAGGHGARRRGDWLVADNGLWLKPGFVEHAHAEDALHTTTTVEIAHPALLTRPCFEYQHARSGDSAGDALRDGFAQWMRMDWKVFLDLANPVASHCPQMEMTFPGTGKDDSVAAARRILLGPVAHMAARQATGTPVDAHPFCPCCLFTHAMDAFLPQLHGEGTFGLRLYAARDADGQTMADCRVNGEQWPAGADALRAYAADWPDRGFESRKQYVMIAPVSAHG